MDLSLAQFSPTKAELAQMVEESKKLVLPDPFNIEQREKVKESYRALVKVRTTITKNGKAMRDDAIAFQKKVIELEKELLVITKSEEERLGTLLEEADKAIERKARVELLPRRKERLAAIDDGVQCPADDFLLDMDGPTFEGFINQRVARKNEAERIALAEREAAVRQEEACA